MTRHPDTLFRLLIVLMTAAFVAACGDGQAGEAPPEAAPVQTAPVVRAPVSPTVVAPGTYGPADEIALSFKVGGVVARVAVDAGDPVRKGQILAELELREVEAMVAQARAAAEQARRDLARAERLHADSVLPLARLEGARTAAQVAEAELERALFNRDHAEIRAPGDGVVLSRYAEGGETVGPAQPILTVGTEAGGGVVRLGLPDRDRLRVEAGDSAVVTFDALPGRRFTGTVARVGATASPRTGTWEVEVAFPGADGLVPGLVGRVEIHPAGGDAVASVPAAAVLEADGEAAAIFVLEPRDDGSRGEHFTARRRQVRIGWVDGERIPVFAGLDDVDEVVTAGAAWLDDGDRVRVVR